MASKKLIFSYLAAALVFASGGQKKKKGPRQIKTGRRLI
jgi:hypothetical protein